ncbi:HAD-IA family hydrolase [Bacillus sp. PK3_68]|uniref:HAD-IA family hydrolase n=1 Tax=Bacillus sp. PK3_68 TaxID=2027408 RepID=UPI000E71B233|nr:HAD-IA family hydrolase [Bacillus sp. PK3_68]RJS61781.1 nucleosidase [Bacillus sp. PK3_68]
MKAMIFDMDGTLFQTNLILEGALEKVFEELRKNGLWTGQIPIEQYREIMGVPLPVVWETLCPHHSIETHRQSNEFFHLQLIELIKGQKGALYPDAEDILEALSTKYTLYIASNGQKEYLQAITDTYKLNRFIKHTYSIQSIPSGHKSDLVKRIILENGIKNGVVVGDRLSDIQAAKDNGLLAIGVNFDFAHPSELKQADQVINSLKELLDLEV